MHKNEPPERKAAGAKACPFCGNKHPNLVQDRVESCLSVCVECEECGCGGPLATYDPEDPDDEPSDEKELEAEALELWNTRSGR